MGKLVLVVLATASSALAGPFVLGDIFASIGNGLVDEYSQTGVLRQTLNTTRGGFTTGSTFDKFGNFYVTAFESNVVSKFDSNGVLVNSAWATGIALNESIVFDAAGNAYIGNAGINQIREVNSSGVLIRDFTVSSNTDWIDLGADQKTMIYSDESNTIRRFDVSANVALPNFTTGPYGSLFAKRFRPNGEVLAASSTGNVYRFDANGLLLQTYATGLGSVFALNLDPNGTAFWTGQTGGLGVKEIDIATGNTLQSWNVRTGTLYGLSLIGEVQAGGGGVGDTPEPGTLVLLGAGSVALLLARRNGVRGSRSDA